MFKSIEELKTNGYQIYKKMSIDNRYFFPVKKDGKFNFFKYQNKEFVEIDDWDNILILDYLNTPINFCNAHHKKIKKLESNGYKIFNTIRVDKFKYLPIKKNGKFFFYKQTDKDYVNLSIKDKILLKNKYGLNAKTPSSKVFALKVTGFLVVAYITAHSLGITNNISLPKSLDGFHITSGLANIINNNKKAKEAVPFFEHFNKVLTTNLSDFNISNERNDPRILITPQNFKADEKVAVAYYRISDNTVHIRSLNYLTYAITHELIHWRTSDFIKNSSYGTIIYESMTVLLDTELFGFVNNDPRRTTEDLLLKVLIESVGIENTLHPFLNNHSIKDISNKIDEVMNIPGYSENMIKTMDSFRLNNINEIPSTHLRDSQLELINLYFQNLYNQTENETDLAVLSEAVRASFRLRVLLTTNHSHNLDFQKLNLNLSDVLDYYEETKNEFLNKLKIKNSFLIGSIQIMESADKTSLMNYFNEKRYIYHGQYVTQYYIHEILLLNGETNYFIEQKSIPYYDGYNKDIIIYRQSHREMTGNSEILVTTSYAYDDINNYENLKEIIKDNPDGIFMGYITDEYGNVDSSFKTNKNGDTISLNIENSEAITKELILK